MDGPTGFDVEQLNAALRATDHALFRLTPAGVGPRLLVDFRTNERAGCAAVLLPEVRSLAERLNTIQKARPELPLLERVHLITWPLRVEALERLGVLGTVRERFASMDAFDAMRQLDEAYRELLRLQRDELRRAVTGDGYRTLWPPVKQA